MTIAIEDAALGKGSRIGLDGSADLAEDRPLPGPALVIAGVSASREDLLAAPSEALIARSVEDFHAMPSVGVRHVIVTANGYNVTLELLESGDLDPAAPIVWSLGLTVVETLARLGEIGLPEDVTVRRIGGEAENSVVTTARGSGLELEFDSFRAGLEVGARLEGRGPDTGSGDYAELFHEFALLRLKHLSVLESLSPVDAPNAATAAHPDAPTADTTRLENDLILLKRRYDALNRKYTALSSSRLGALTLQLWARKNPRRNKAIPAKDGEK